MKLISRILLIVSASTSVCRAFTTTTPSQSMVRITGNTPHLPRVKTSSSSALRAQLEAILWDMDGVLADTERDGHRPAFNLAFKEAGIDTEWDVERYGKLLKIGGGKERMTAHWNEVGWPSAVLRSTRQDKVKELHLRKTDIFMDMINQKKIPLRPGVLRVVDEAIAAGVRLAVCSTSNEKAVRNLVNTLMGAERAAKFDVFAGDMVKNKKPAPDVYLMAVDQMGLDKSRCVIVEDSEIGLKSAIAAGIKCIVTKSSYTAGEDFTGADMVVDELGDDPTKGVTLTTLAGLVGGKVPAQVMTDGVPPPVTSAAADDDPTPPPPAPVSPPPEPPASREQPKYQSTASSKKGRKGGLDVFLPDWT